MRRAPGRRKRETRLPYELMRAGPAGGLHAHLRAFLEALAVLGRSRMSQGTRHAHLAHFVTWCEDRGVSRSDDVTRPILERYQRALFVMRKRNGAPLSFRSQHGHLSSAKAFFAWLCRQNFIPANPAADIELPKYVRALPRHVLTATEAEQVLVVPDVTDPLGLRDRAILETLYSTGIRRSELIGLDVFDLDFNRGTLHVRNGKGGKARVVPIGERALRFVDRYMVEARPKLVVDAALPALFLTHHGDRLGLQWLSHTVRRYVDQASVGKTGSCHLFRHTMATLMLENGADVRFIQAILGHAHLSSTEIYTHVSIMKLKEIHTATHPANVERRARSAGDDTTPTADELLAALAHERDEEHDAK